MPDSTSGNQWLLGSDDNLLAHHADSGRAWRSPNSFLCTVLIVGRSFEPRLREVASRARPKEPSIFLCSASTYDADQEDQRGSVVKVGKKPGLSDGRRAVEVGCIFAAFAFTV
jgi:hypothetical protein